jgi:uncharacterized protein
MIRADPPLDEIVRRIVEHVRPRRIVLFGSRARGDFDAESDVDIMVEMETDLRPAARRVQVASLFPHRWWSMDVLVYTPEEVAELRKDPGHFLHEIMRDGRVLYTAASDVPAPKRVREREPRLSRARAWLSHADEDRRTFEICLRAELIPFTSVCFHAQQAAEKYMKALLELRGVITPRTHDLSRLLLACREAGDDLGPLSAECELLTQYAVEPRYPGAGVPRLVTVDEEAREAVRAAYRVMAAVAPRLGLLP